MLQNLAHVAHHDDLKALFHVVRNVRKVFLVLFRDQHRLDTTPQGSQKFLFQSADWHCITAQGHLARHRNILANRDLGQNRDNRRHHRKTS